MAYQSSCESYCFIEAGQEFEIKCHNLPNGEPWYFHARAQRDNGKIEDVVLSEDFEDDSLVQIKPGETSGLCLIEVSMWRPKKPKPGQTLPPYQAHLECINLLDASGKPMHAHLRIKPDHSHAVWLIYVLVKAA